MAAEHFKIFLPRSAELKGRKRETQTQAIVLRQKLLTRLPCAHACALHEELFPILSRISTESVEILERLMYEWIGTR